MNACSSLVILLLMGVCCPANGQDKPPVATGPPPPVPVMERHRNPDYVAPVVKQPDSQHAPKRPEISGEYAIPFGPDQVFALARYRAIGIPFRISPDGKWLILIYQTGEGDDTTPAVRQPPFWPGLFGEPRPHDSFSIIR